MKKGDVLATQYRDKYLLPCGFEPINFTTNIGTLPSSESEFFTEESLSLFWSAQWCLQANSSRMGYRFKGQKLSLKAPLEMLSHAVPMGTMQVPPDGQPIILMADTQTTGGYPKLACVIQADLGKLAQIGVNQKVRFYPVTIEEAKRRLATNDEYLNRIRNQVNEIS